MMHFDGWLPEDAIGTIYAPEEPQVTESGPYVNPIAEFRGTPDGAAIARCGDDSYEEGCHVTVLDEPLHVEVRGHSYVLRGWLDAPPIQEGGLTGMGQGGGGWCIQSGTCERTDVELPPVTVPKNTCLREGADGPVVGRAKEDMRGFEVKGGAISLITAWGTVRVWPGEC